MAGRLWRRAVPARYIFIIIFLWAHGVYSTLCVINYVWYFFIYSKDYLRIVKIVVINLISHIKIQYQKMIKRHIIS